MQRTCVLIVWFRPVATFVDATTGIGIRLSVMVSVLGLWGIHLPSQALPGGCHMLLHRVDSVAEAVTFYPVWATVI